MLNALKMNRKAFTRKENPIPADKNRTLTKIERNMRKQGMEGSICVSVWFLSAGMGFSFRVKALRFIFKAFNIRFVYTCSLHVPFIFPCTLYIYIHIYIYIFIYIYIYIYIFMYIYIYIYIYESITLCGVYRRWEARRNQVCKNK